MRANDLLNLAKTARSTVDSTTDPDQKKVRAARLKEFAKELAGTNRLALLQMIAKSI